MLRPRSHVRLGLALTGSLAAWLIAAPAGATHPEVLIVVNGESEISRAIGEYYRRSRGIPRENVLALSVPISDPSLASPRHESIGRADFEKRVRDPIADHLKRRGLADRIEIIVTTKGVPLRVLGNSVPLRDRLRDATAASVDAELALLFSGLDGAPGIERTVNPYFDAAERFGAFRSSHSGAPLRYLVARLTGYQGELDPKSGVPADVKALIDAAQAEGEAGAVLVDEHPGMGAGRRAGNPMLLEPAAVALRAAGLRVLHDTSPRFVSDVRRIAGYTSWGSNDPGNPGPPFYGEIGGKLYPGRFAPRAIAVDLVSTNARSFTDPVEYG